MMFSIVVPVYKVEEFLPVCVDSILNQTFGDYELILVDDGSPDKCPELCDLYAEKDNHVKVIHKQNGGLSDARNAGINVAVGDYIIFVDSDDYWERDTVLKEINEVLKEHRADVVQHSRKRFYHRDKRLVEYPSMNLEKYNGSETIDVIGYLVESDKLNISAWSTVVSRKMIIENNLFFKKGIKTEDLEWAIRLYACEPKWSFIDDSFYVYRMQRDGQITSVVDYKHLCDYCWILENSVNVIEKCEENIEKALMSYLMYQSLIASAHISSAHLSKKEKKELYLRVKAVCKGRLSKYALNKRVKFASIIYRFFGYEIMAKLLGFYLKNR